MPNKIYACLEDSIKSDLNDQHLTGYYLPLCDLFKNPTWMGLAGTIIIMLGGKC